VFDTSLTFMKVWALSADENWICDQLVNEWNLYSNCATQNINEADIIWLFSDWKWRSIPLELLRSKKVVTTVHHIVPEKFDSNAKLDFAARDSITDLYHVYNQRVYDFISPLTNKQIKLVPYWANQYLWKPSLEKISVLRTRYNLPQSAYILGSFQRDTEGHDLISPKLEKGPDLLADAIIKLQTHKLDLHILLAGWRRQYICKRLTEAKVKFTYYERPTQNILAELYQTLDVYAVTARTEGGPQALIECGLMNVPVVSTPVGIAEQVLPESAINTDVTLATPTIPNVNYMKLPHGMDLYHAMFESLI
jgi:glycosyltransferase involved in cell wall biosynthesis